MDLRKKAEEKARLDAGRMPEDLAELPPQEARLLLHELRVHQIELEMQNEELQRAQAELEASRARYFDLYDLAPAGYFTLSDKGQILEANLAAARLLGADRGSLAKQFISRFILPKDQDLLYRYRQEALAGGAQKSCELRMLRPGASPLWVRWEESVERSADGTPMHRAVMSDISELKRAEEKAQAYLNLVETTIVSIAADGKVSSINQAGCRLLGWREEEIIGKVWFDHFLPERIRGNIKDTFGRLMSGEPGGPTSFENPIVTKDGEERVILWHNTTLMDESGRATGTLSSGEDITERKQWETSLKDSEERFRRLFETSRDALMTLAPPSWTFTSGNPATIAMFRAKDEADFTSRGPWELSPERQPDGRASSDKAREMIETAMREGSSFFEWTHRRLDGEDFPVDVLLTRLETGGKTFLQATVRDLSERINAEKERESMQGQLRQSQRMEVVGRLAGGVAHDFNNLLTAILGNCTFLLADIPKEDPRRADVEEIRKAGERAANLTRQLLAFSRKQVLQPRIMDMNSVLADMEKLLRRLIGEDIELRISRAEGLAPVKADPGQMEQIVMNLAVNARDAMRQGGCLSIETGNLELPKPQVLAHDAPVPPGRYVLMAVGDTGSGMDAQTAEHVFEPFFTTKEAGKGTGLGLSTVYGIVKQSGGFIDVQSEPGKGATFKIFLPAASGAALERGGEAEGEGAGQKKRWGQKSPGTILLVEDDDVVRRIALRILTDAGYLVIEAKSGQEALAHLDEHFDLVLTDIVLQDMPGVEVAARLKNARPSVRVVFTSGYADNPDIRDVLAKPENRFLQKPFSAQALRKMVQEALV